MSANKQHKIKSRKTHTGAHECNAFMQESIIKPKACCRMTMIKQGDCFHYVQSCPVPASTSMLVRSRGRVSYYGGYCCAAAAKRAKPLVPVPDKAVDGRHTARLATECRQLEHFLAYWILVGVDADFVKCTLEELLIKVGSAPNDQVTLR